MQDHKSNAKGQERRSRIPKAPFPAVKGCSVGAEVSHSWIVLVNAGGLGTVACRWNHALDMSALMLT